MTSFENIIPEKARGLDRLAISSKILAMLILIFAAGLGMRSVRLIGPLDGGVQRQLHGAIIARGYYYQMDPKADPLVRQKMELLANTEPFFEPRVFERIVAVTYLIMGGEYLWVSRLYAILFWMIGGVALYDLARRISSAKAGLISLLFYLFTPLGIEYSRKFQPDGFMVMGFIIAADVLYIWSQKQTWKYAVLAGLIAGIAVFIKVQCALPTGMMGGFLVLGSLGFKKAIKSLQVWLIFALMIGIPAVYYFLINTGSASGYFSYWSLSLLYMIFNPEFYPRWLLVLVSLFGGPFVLVALLGLFFARSKEKMLLLGMLVGYFLFGLSLPFLIQTHAYYSLIFIPILGLSLAPASEILIEKISRGTQTTRYLFIGIILLGMGYAGWIGRNFLSNAPEPVEEGSAWKHMGEELPPDGRIIGLIQDYGLRLKYFGMRNDVDGWPSTSDLRLDVLRNGSSYENFDQYFETVTAQHRYFLVTDFSDLKNQPKLKSYLELHYPVVKTGDGYVLYDLEQKR